MKFDRNCLSLETVVARNSRMNVKTTAWIWLFAFAGVRAETNAVDEESAYWQRPDSHALDSKARIVGLLPDGSPPPVVILRPKLRFSPSDIVSSRSVKLGERRMIFEKVVPIELPAVPNPASPEPGDQQAFNDLDSLREELKGTKLVFAGASVFHSKDAPDQPRTFVRFWPEPGAEPIAIWSTADWEYLTGFASFQGGDGQQYGLIMATSASVVEKFSDIDRLSVREYGASPVPGFRKKSLAGFTVVEGKVGAETLAAIEALHELYLQ